MTSVAQYVIVVAVFGVTQGMFLSQSVSQYRKLQQGLSAKETSVASSQGDQEADGCKHVFLDVGANMGVHVRMIFEPHLYKKSSSLKFLDQHFGNEFQRTLPSNVSGICAFGFEANPRFATRHRAIEAAYAKKGWRVKFFTPSVVADSDGNVTFFLNDEPENSAWGSSVVDRRKLNPNREFVPTVLPKLNFVKWVKANLVDRHLPKGDSKGKTLMKMDIEGAEFSVIPAMLASGELCQNSGIDVAMVEEHTRLFKETDENFTSWRTTMYQISNQRDCTPTVMKNADDESYLKDISPLP